MKLLNDYKEQIHSCSKCGLCQSVCPVYKITGNDCTVSRGHFIMLMGLIKGDLCMSKTINRYIDLCLKCNSCSKFCPSGIDIVDVISSAKHEYFVNSRYEKFISFIQKCIVLYILPIIAKVFYSRTKSKLFNKKVIYFGGCKSKLKGYKNIVKILNLQGIEVITPKFDCCGLHFYLRGDFETFEYCKKSFIKNVENLGVSDVITDCASCEKMLKSYNIPNLSIKNIYEYINPDENFPKLKKKQKVTFHKPCNMENYNYVKNILNSIKELEFIEMEDFDKCCGFNGLLNFKEYKIISKILLDKRKKIISTGAKIVLTTCFGCEIALRIISFGKYKVENLIDFIAKHSSD